MAGKNPVIPAHVPQELVRDFDIYDPPGVEDDYHLAMKKIQDESPDVFWSPYQGGHWVAVRGEDLYEMFKDYTRFSNRIMTLPKEESPPVKYLPEESDPPQHTAYRSVISRFFTPQTITPLEGKVRSLAISLIEGFHHKGECEFMSEFALHLPIAIFLSLVDLPMSKKEFFLPLVHKATNPSDHDGRMEAYTKMSAYLGEVLAERREKPGDDLLSSIVKARFDGKPMTHEEQIGMAIVVMLGGFDTVPAILGHTVNFLARNPGHRQQLLDDPELIPKSLDELIRRHGVANPGRIIAKDIVYKGVVMKEGDQIVLASPMHGLDERCFPNPLEVDFHRPTPIHSHFGNGPHRCPGSFLARTELKVFLQEWLPRIPHFRIKEGEKPRAAGGNNGHFTYLPIAWDVPS